MLAVKGSGLIFYVEKLQAWPMAILPSKWPLLESFDPLEIWNLALCVHLIEFSLFFFKSTTLANMYLYSL